jgi:hypothetical protein
LHQHNLQEFCTLFCFLFCWCVSQSCNAKSLKPLARASCRSPDLGLKIGYSLWHALAMTGNNCKDVCILTPLLLKNQPAVQSYSY